MYDCRVYAILSEKENLGVPFARIVKGAPCAAMKGFYEGLKKDDYLGKTVQFAMNYGFDRSVKKILDELADVYKIAFDKNPKFTEAQKKYTDVKKEIERAGVLKCDFLFKDILLKNLTAAIEKTEVFADKEMEMFVPGLDERMSESKEAFLKLKDALDGVFDWSSEAALERAKEIVFQIRIWNNVKIVVYRAVTP